MRWMMTIALVLAACTTEAERRAKQEEALEGVVQSAKDMRDLEVQMGKDMQDLQRKLDADFAPMKRETDAWSQYGAQTADLQKRMMDAQLAAIDAKTPGDRKSLQAKADALKAERDRLLAKWREAGTAPVATGASAMGGK